jgi:hypothetical protein
MTSETQELIAAGERRKAELIEMAGGLLISQSVAPLINMPVSSIEEQRKAGTIIAVRAGVDYGYPACQFDLNGVVPGLSDASPLCQCEPTGCGWSGFWSRMMHWTGVPHLRLLG